MKHESEAGKTGYMFSYYQCLHK